MTRLSTIGFITSFFLFFAPLAAATNYTQCLVDFRNGNDTQNGTDYRGDRVDPKSAVGMTYAACRDRCGVGREPFNWSIFSQQFSAWLLPWLALVSQLPFGAESRLDNLISGQSPPTCIIVPAFLPSHISHPRRWVPHPRSVLSRPHRRQHSLGQHPFLGYRVPQPRECRQGSHPPPTGPATSNHP